MSAPQATSSIGRKILIRSMIVAIVPLLLLGVAVYLGVASLRSNASDKVAESRELLSEETIVVTSQGQANSVAKEINLLMVERVGDVLAWSRSVEIVDGAREASIFSEEQELVGQDIEALETRYAQSKTTGIAFRAQQYLSGELGQSREFTEISITDENGYNAAHTNNIIDDFVQSDEEWWQEAWENGIFVSEVQYDETTRVFSIDIASRIQSAVGGAPHGVLQSTLDIGFVRDITDSSSTDQVDFVVSLDDGRLIAETQFDHDVDRLLNDSLSTDEVSEGLSEAVQGDNELDADASGESVWGYTRTTNPELYSSITGFDGFDWIVVSTQSADSAFAPLAGIEDLDNDIDESGNNLLLITLGVLFLAALVAFFSARFLAESIVNPIRKLTEAASKAASDGLPSAVAEINTTGVDPESIEAPQVTIDTNDELEVLAGSFNSVQDSAVRLAAEQALSRRNTSEMFVNLGRRNQSLLKRQLRSIDSLEKNEKDPDTLESLFKLDHLATRMRRNAESLLVIAGDQTPRRWAAPVPVDQAVQAALAEVENYDRVDASGLDQGQVKGSVVADVAHVLAELIENALNFSPPQSTVTVSGQKSGDDYTILIADEGLGMPAEEIELANTRLRESHEISDVPSRYLGLFVVGQLAHRHGLDVSLADRPTGTGLQASITLPSFITEVEQAQSDLKPDGSTVSVAEDIENLSRVTKSSSDEDADERIASEDHAESDDDADEKPVESDDAESDDVESDDDADEKSVVGVDVESDDDADEKSVVGVDAESDDDADEKPVESDDDESDESTSGSGKAPAVAVPTGKSKVDTARSTGSTNQFGRRIEDETADTALVSGKEFPRRMPVSSASKDEVVEAEGVENSSNGNGEADAAAKAAMAGFGFSRRESKKSSNTNLDTKKSMKATTEAPGDVMEDAEQSRNRWSQFQRGKEDAENEVEE